METEAYGSNTPRPPPEIKEEDCYEVERLLKHREQKNGKFRFLVKWKGYPEEATWEDEDILIDGLEKMVEQYKKTQVRRRKPNRRISTVIRRLSS